MVFYIAETNEEKPQTPLSYGSFFSNLSTYISDMKTHIYDDRPLIDPKADKLGFTKPANSLADLFAHTTAPDGFVAAVTGDWGSGKSTFLNFITSSEALFNTQSGLPRLEIIRFDPWLVSGRQDLVAAYFKHLADELKTNRDKAKSLAKTGGRVVAEVGKASVDNALTRAAADIAILADGGLLAKPASVLARKSLEKASKALSKEPSLQKAYSLLADKLSKSERRFLVVIDEIDRLTPKEIRTLLNMVKAVGRLPNVIYLLSYDRRIVHGALGRGDEEQGCNYSEKIVQHEFALPTPLVGGVLSILDEHISELLGDTENDMRWHRYVSSGLRRWVQKPRDVIRLAAAFNFAGEQLKDEVDLQDVLILEGLRLFQPKVYDWIRQNDAFLFGTRSSYMTDTKKQEIGQSLVECVEPDSKDDTLSLVVNLFSHRAASFPGQSSYTTTSHYQAQIKGYVQTEPAYRAYFATGLPEGAIPRVTLDLLASPGTTLKRFNEVFAQIDVKDSNAVALVSTLVEGIRFRVEDNAAEMPFDVLDGLGTHYDLINQVNENAEIFQSPYHLMVGTVRACLRAWGPEGANEYANHLLDGELSLEFKTLVMAEIMRSFGLLPTERTEDPLVEAESAKELYVKIISQIQLAAKKDGGLGKNTSIWRPLKIWAELDDSGAAKDWTHKNIQSDQSILYKICRSVVSRTLGDDVQYTLRDDPTSKYVDLAPLVAAAKAALDKDLSQDERRLFTEINEGGQRYLSEQDSQSKS